MKKLLVLALAITLVFSEGLYYSDRVKTSTQVISHEKSSVINTSVTSGNNDVNVDAAVISADDSKISIDPLGAEANDPDFLRIINNYFGCKTWENG